MVTDDSNKRNMKNIDRGMRMSKSKDGGSNENNKMMTIKKQFSINN